MTAHTFDPAAVECLGLTYVPSTGRVVGNAAFPFGICEFTYTLSNVAGSSTAEVSIFT